MDRILIKKLRARCIIGVNEEERREKQDVVIDIAISAGLRKAGKTDRFEDALDYRAVKKRVLKAVEGSSFHLIEALAESIAAICLEHPMAQKVSVRVEKPLALRFAESAGVEIERSK
ncbi:MAG: dihydroneopterin aldolase [Nitrospiraceae bacterium]|nr:dihydroneopterin aldolase [Nitrospiraceae bacterium]